MGNLREFNITKVILSFVVLIIGLFLKFPEVVEDMSGRYVILNLITVTASQYSIINIISIVIILASSLYIIILLINKFRK